jgi:hypothetical protein
MYNQTANKRGDIVGKSRYTGKKDFGLIGTGKHTQEKQ